MILIVCTGVNRKDFRTESCRWISMQTVAPLYQVCDVTNQEKSGTISASVQCQARFSLNFEEKFWYSCNLDVFCDKRMAILQIKFGYFSGLETVGLAFFGLFFALFGFLLEFSSGNPGCAECFSISGYCFPSVAVLLLFQINLSGSGLYIIT